MNLISNSLQLMIIVTMIHSIFTLASRKISKRIISGRIMLERDSFSALKYYVWIRDLHHCYRPLGNVFIPPKRKKQLLRRKPIPCPPTPEFLACGGVLLTPKIVQTTCHCIARFCSRKDGSFSDAVEKKAWEKMYTIYPAWNDVYDMPTDGLLSARYYVHRKCARMNWVITVGKKRKFKFGYVVHNYGLIHLKDSVEDSEEISNQVSYAPIYNRKEIANLWTETLSKEYTCLFFGFGYFNRTIRNNKIVPNKEKSTYMRIGWRIITNYYDCYDFTYPPEHRDEFKFDYEENATWSCAVSHILGPNTKDDFLAQCGDSGGPVTCNGNYYGIIGEPDNINADVPVSLVSPIAFTMYENAIQFRPKFVKFIEKITEYPDDPTHNPINPRPRHYSAKSKEVIHQPTTLIIFLCVHITIVQQHLIYYQ